jgi:chromosomal replication initiation ATPase DnaA
MQDKIIDIILFVLNVPREWLTNHSQKTECVRLRQAVSFYLKKYTDKSSREISNVFDKNNHGIVNSGAIIWEQNVAISYEYKMWDKKIKEQIENVGI